MNLRNDKRQKNTQETLDFHSEPTGEARQAGGEGTESVLAVHAALVKKVVFREVMRPTRNVIET